MLMLMLMPFLLLMLILAPDATSHADAYVDANACYARYS
jgi:hypothetical protein